MRYSLYLSLLWLPSSFSFWWWSTNDEDLNDNYQHSSDAVKEDTAVANMFAPFEISVGEQKFLSEANHFLQNLPMLDQCNLLIINRIKTSCQNLNDEELSKLSVNLLNCQSAVEGRPLYKCTDTMKLADCTQGMDSDTWNSYHIISNRARAICYSVRQTEFRMKTEMTVNNLASATLENVNVLKNLASDQKKLQEVTDDALNMITKNQDQLLAKQEDFKEKQNLLNGALHDNMNTLLKEKRVIAHRHKQVEEYTHMINYQLASLVKEIKTHEMFKKKSEKEILKGLDTVKLKADEVLKKLEFAFDDLDVYHENLEVKQNKTLKNLEEIQETISFMNDVLTKLYSSVHEQLPWLHEMFGGTLDKLALVTLITGHALFFFTAFMAIIFVNAPSLTRVFMLLVIPINCMSAMQNLHHLTYVQLSWFLALTIPVDFAAKKMIRLVENIRASKDVVVLKDHELYPEPPMLTRCTVSRDLTPQLQEKSFDFLNLSPVKQVLTEEKQLMSNATSQPTTKFIERANDQNIESNNISTPKGKRKSFPMTPSPGLNNTIGGSIKCTAFTRTGTRCRNSAMCLEKTCRVHTPQK